MQAAMATETFRRARDFLLTHRTDYRAAHAGFSWPRFDTFNWAFDWFDAVARDNRRPALRIIGDNGEDQSVSFEDLRVRSSQVAHFLRGLGVRRGERILLMVGNEVPLWEVMLGAIKLGCPIIPTTTLMMPAELRDRLQRSEAKIMITEPELADRVEPETGNGLRILTHGEREGWRSLDSAHGLPTEFTAEQPTPGDEPLLLYFTSGTTARPKLVVQTHVSYPVGHLSTMYWIGLRPGDVHLNVSSAGWAKHAWSSFFAPWNAEATILATRTPRFNPVWLLEQLERCEVTSLCAPPTVWRALVQLPLEKYPVHLREVVSAGEPLNPEVIARVRDAWGLTIRDGYGQTETSLQIGNFPGQPVAPGAMGFPAPGFAIDLRDAREYAAEEGEICVRLEAAFAGVTPGYLDDPERTQEIMARGHYHTGDIAVRDAEGRYTYVGRTDDVFKSSDYRISPFELESTLLEHGAVAEAAVVPSPDPRRLSVPKAYVSLVAGNVPSRETALDILRFTRTRLSPFKRIRRIEFADLPKTVSGKIRRVQLRAAELQRPHGDRHPLEYWEENFPELLP